MSSAIYFNLDQSKILLLGNGLIHTKKALHPTTIDQSHTKNIETACKTPNQTVSGFNKILSKFLAFCKFRALIDQIK